MKPVILRQPSPLVIGDGCAPQCAEWLAARGARRVLLVTSTPVWPALVSVMAALRQAQLDVVQSPPVDAEPTCAFFDLVLAGARARKVDAVLGIGGGSVLDVAKLAAALLTGPQTLPEVFGQDRLAGRKLLLVCLPTTAGTGSEVSPNAILLDETDQVKKAVVSPHLVPDAAFVDPTLTWSVPPDVTAATGLDALTHCLEAYANKQAHPVVDIYALEGLRLISASLERAVRQGHDAEARAHLALGSVLGGLCLGPVNTAAVHALAYPLGGRFRVPHGLANALLLPHVLRFNVPAAPQRYAAAALALGAERAGSDLEIARRGVDRIAQLVAACGLPSGLAALGVPRDALPELARAAMQVTRLLQNNPRPLTEADALQIYQAAY